jgi:hypothetical protein
MSDDLLRQRRGETEASQKVFFIPAHVEPPGH